MFDNLLQLAADDDKVKLNEMAAKFPTLKEYFELGEKVKPVRERLKSLHPTYENDFEAPVKELEDWRKFRANDWPAWQTEHERLQTALAEAAATVADLQNGRSAEVTPDEIKQIVKETLDAAGLVRNSDLDAQMTKLVNEKVGPTLDSKVNGLTSRFEKVFSALTPKVSQHEKDFGEVLPMDKVIEHMKVMAEDRFRKSGVRQDIDPIEAYNDLFATKFTEKSSAQTAAEKKAEYDRGVAEGTKKALQEVGKNRSPVDGGDSGGGRRQGALMRRAEARMPKKADGDLDTSKIPLGKGIARVATQEYFDKKAGAVQ
jgi:hypothetical protein